MPPRKIKNNLITKVTEKHFGNVEKSPQEENNESYCFNCGEFSDQCECGYINPTCNKTCNNLDCNLKYDELLNKYENSKDIQKINLIDTLKELNDDEILMFNPLYVKIKEDNNNNIDIIEKLNIKLNKYKTKIHENNKILHEAGIEYVEDIQDLFNSIEEYKKENEDLRIKIKEYENNQVNDLEIKNISETSTFPDYFTIHLFSETEEEKQIKKLKEKEEKLKTFNKKILKSKFMTVCHHAFLNKDNLIKEKEEKENILRKKIFLNQIKYKARTSLIKFNEDNLALLKIVNNIKKNKEIMFDNKNIHSSAVNSNRGSMKFLSDLYEEKEINKSLSNKDFMLAVNEFHSDKNSTRLNHLCKIIYNLRKNDIIWNSSIIFKHIYSFQYLKDYQIPYLIHHIETIIKT